MPRHQIRNPSLLDPSRGSAASASLLASHSLPLSLFFRLFPPLFPLSTFLSFSRCISLSLSLFVSRERAHVKSLKGDEQTTRKPWGLLALAARLVQIFSLLPPCCRDSVCRTLFGGGRGRRGRNGRLKPPRISFPGFFLSFFLESGVAVREVCEFQFRVDRGRRRFHLLLSIVRFHRAMMKGMRCERKSFKALET